MPKFRCKVVIPTRELFNGVASYVEVPGEIGNFGVLAGHEKIVAKNRPGIVTVTTDESPSGEKRRFAVYEGVTQMMDDQLIVMGRMGCELEKIDVEDVRRKAEEMREVIADLEQRADDESVAAKLDVQRDRLGWYETQLEIAGRQHA